MKLPELPDRGLTKRGRMFVRECLEYMRASTPVAGNGISIRQLSGGTQITAKAADVDGGTQGVYFFRNGALVKIDVVISGAVEAVS